MHYPLNSNSWDDEEKQALQRVVESDRFTMGQEVATFEKQFASYVGSRNAVMVNSGSSANLIMMAALKLRPSPCFGEPGLKIIVPAVGWSTTYFPVHQYGYGLVFVDVDPLTFNMNSDQVNQALKNDSSIVAVLAVNLLGNPAPLDELRGVCYYHGVTLLEDNCESLGATVVGKHCGTWGEMGTFSFFFSHHLQTMEGGMVVTDNGDLVDYLRSLRAHGWVRELPMDSKLYQRSGTLFYDRFRFVLPGYNVRPLEMSGAVGQVQLRKVPRFIMTRRANGAVAQRLFDGCDYLRLQKENDHSSWFGFGFVCQGVLKGRRAEVIDALTQADIETRPIVAGNFVRNPVIKYLAYETVGSLEAADDLHDNGFFIGNDGCADVSPVLEEVADIIRKVV